QPVNGTFYLYPTSIRATLTFRNIFTVNFCYLSVFVSFIIFTLYNVSVFQTHLMSFGQTEVLGRRIFHKVIPFYPKLSAEGDFSMASIFILWIILSLKYFRLPFRIVGDNQLNRIQHGHSSQCYLIQMLTHTEFQQANVD